MTCISRSIGWLLDISIEQNLAIIWIKTTEGNILKLIDSYQPSIGSLKYFYLPINRHSGVICMNRLNYNVKINNLYDYYNLHQLEKSYPYYL